MKRLLQFGIVIILILIMTAPSFASPESIEDAFPNLDRRDEEGFPEDFDSGIAISSSIDEVNQEGIPIIKIRLRKGTSFTSMGFLGTSNSSIEIRNGLTNQLLKTTDPGQQFTISTIPTGVRVGEFDLNAESFILVPVKPTDRIKVSWPTGDPHKGPRDYRGYLEISRVSTTSTNLKFVNTISIEEYLYGVVPNEMPGSWPIEALKAQAITARTYALVNMNKHKIDGYNICDSSACCQAYLTSSSEHYKATDAVNETTGKVASYQGNYISTYYSSSTGGHTESYFNWGGFSDPSKPSLNPPYLQAVSDPYDANSSNSRHSWIRLMSLEDLTARFSGKGVGQVSSVEQSQPQTLSGRQMQITIRGSSSNFVISGQSNIRREFGFWSAKFNIIPKLGGIGLWTTDRSNATILPIISSWNITGDVTLDGAHIIGGNGTVLVNPKSVNVIGYVDRPTEYEFVGGGWGHGVGMSQYGALGMASAGKTCDEILKHYYQGIDIVSAY